MSSNPQSLIPNFAWRRLLGLLGILLLGVAAGAAVAWGKPAIAIAAVVAGVIGVALLQHVQWAVWALAAVLTLLPFGALPLGIGFNPTLLNLAFVLMLAAWLMVVVGHGEFGWRTTPLWLPTLVYGALAVFAFLLGSENALLTRDLLRRFVEFLLTLSLVWLLPTVLRSYADVINATRALVLSGGVAAALGLGLWALPDATETRLLSLLRVFDYPTGERILRYINDDPSLPQRATSTSVDPNAFGGLLIIVAALTIPNLFARRPILPRWLAWGLVSVMGLALFATRSRGSMLGLLAAAAFLALLRYRRLALWLVVAVALALVLPWTQEYVASFFAGARGQDLSTQMRLGEYKDAINLIGRHPLFGVGYAATPDIDLYIGVSSMYLLLAENMGLVGLAAFAAVALVFFWTARAGLRTGDLDLEPVILGGAAAIFGVLVAGALDHYFVNIKFPASVTLFWFVVSLTATVATLAVRQRAEAAAESPAFAARPAPAPPAPAPR